jgi:hypothetical protein
MSIARGGTPLRTAFFGKRQGARPRVLFEQLANQGTTVEPTVCRRSRPPSEGPAVEPEQDKGARKVTDVVQFGEFAANFEIQNRRRCPHSRNRFLGHLIGARGVPQ